MTSCAVCVTYHPDRELLTKLVAATLPQVDRLYLVENGPPGALQGVAGPAAGVEIITLPGNQGIAAGFNAGISAARAAGFDYVLLLDQDSVPPPDMVRRYQEVLNAADPQALPIAALGPRHTDPDYGHLSTFIRFHWFGNTHHGGSQRHPQVPADFLISSGTFYAIEVFGTVGLFNESLFIDHVDTEWCHRALARGYRLLGLHDVLMQHSLGEKMVRLWCFGWHYQPIHKPFRLYFITRNSLLLYRMEHVPGRWISGDVFRLLRLIVMNILFSGHRLEALCWFVLGLRDGVCRVSGPGPQRIEG